MSHAVAILRSDPTLCSAFLLRHAAGRGTDAFTDEQASQFLLWFALEGRKRYHHAVVTPAYLAFLATPVPPFVSRLAAYVLMRRPDLRKRFGSDVDGFHAWYFHEGLTELGIGAFTTARDQYFLDQPHPRFAGQPAPLTRRAYFSYLRDEAARRRFNVANPVDRELFLAAQAGDRRDEVAAWFEPPPELDRSHLPGVNVVGFADGVLGIGEDARALVRALGAAGIPRAVVRVGLSERHATNDVFAASAALGVDRPLYPINVFALTAFETVRIHIEQGSALFTGRYNIGYWPWELTSLPRDWRGAFRLVNEIWASSDFLRDVYSRLTTKPVHPMPPYLNVPAPVHMPLEPLGIAPENIVFLTMFDFNSYVARKNPEGAIQAFRKAFPKPGGRERLIIKTLNGHAHEEALRSLEESLGDDYRFVLVDGAFSRVEVCSLIASVDCFVSLHRSEGFGRVIAEAMLLGTAVIATNWSGNASFLDHETGYAVDYVLRDVRAGEYVFHEGSQWAEPSLDDAVLQFRKARDCILRDGAMRDRARAAVLGRYDLQPVADVLAERIEAVSLERGLRRLMARKKAGKGG